MSTLIARVDEVVIPFLRRWGIPTLRISLAVVFIWFGALKVFGVSPVVELVASTVYWVDPDWFVPALGVIEVLVGVGLAARFGLRLVLLVLALQMLGTFLVFLLLPELTFQDGNPLQLTIEGEFVLKNLVLLASAMVVGASIDAPEVLVVDQEPATT
ncbi:MAG TPA: DoxX family membrane protein [Acidimicrobiia bacterium]|nr:DoxX family membrane protein [Acidimicrobiia bacterium]